MISTEEYLQMNQAELIAKIMYLEDEVARLQKNDIELSWQLNPDRMGGQFTNEEMHRHDRNKK